MTWDLRQGDALIVLKSMPDNSVHCVVTSPPYWGLRDYGTATWEGGDAECDHISRPQISAKATSNRGALRDNPYKNACGKCGAVRVDGQMGLERTPEEYIAKMVEVFREVRRVLRADGVCFVNMGDSYHNGDKGGYAKDRVKAEDSLQRSNLGANFIGAPNRQPHPSLKPKDLCGIPWMLAFALRADGWWLRQDIIWSKPNPMPESVTDRCTKAHEYIFLLTKAANYFYDAEAVKEAQSLGTYERFGNGGAPRAPRTKEGGSDRSTHQFDQATPLSIMPDGTRNRRSVWEIATAPFPEAHFATLPPKLVQPCILAGTSEKGCCPECGAPWERITEKSVRFESGSGKAGNPPDGKNGSEYGQALSGDYDIRMGPVTETRTLGWQPTCKCGKAETVPCTVLDPFSGAGTTGLVGLRLGRSYIGIELSSEYVAMQKRRIVADAPLFNSEELPDVSTSS